MFFFEKKNQKTFAHAAGIRVPTAPGCQPHEQKFFASFFQKRRPYFSI
jgi:hypothetical protein